MKWLIGLGLGAIALFLLLRARKASAQTVQGPQGETLTNGGVANSGGAQPVNEGLRNQQELGKVLMGTPLAPVVAVNKILASKQGLKGLDVTSKATNKALGFLSSSKWDPSKGTALRITSIFRR